jgi:hypothetical protein
MGEWLLLDNLVQQGAEGVVPCLGVMTGQFAKLAGASVVG